MERKRRWYGGRRSLSLSLWAGLASPAATMADGDQSKGLDCEFHADRAMGEGVQLHVMRAGQGPLMLFLHGAPDGWHLYARQLRAFCRDYAVAAPNLRGFPPSDAPGLVEDYTMSRLLGDVHGVLDHFGRPRCVLVGNDWGGYIAWVFASAYPDRVERLIVLNAPHPAIHLREVRTNPRQIQASQYERAFHIAAAPYPPWYNYYRADPITVPASLAEAASLEWPDLAAAFFRGATRPPSAIGLQVDRPVLVIWGMRDPELLPEQLDGLDRYAPDLTILRLADAGHYPMVSHSEAVISAMREFLTRP